METIHYLLDISKENTKDLLTVFFWVLLVFLSVYYLPSIFGIIISLALSIYSLTTKKNVVIISIYFVLAMGVGGVFKVNDLPRISFIKGMSLNTLDLMVIPIFFKVLSNKVKFNRAIFSKFFILFSIYILINFIITTITFGLNLDIGFNQIRIFFYYILYFFVVISIKDVKSISLLINVFFIILLLVFSFQLLLFFGKINIRSYLGKGTSGKITMYQKSYGTYGGYRTNAVRAMQTDILTPFIIFILSLGFINNVKNKKYNSLFLISISIFIISVFISATRVWTAILSITLIGFLRFKKNIRKFVKIGIIGVLLFFSIFMLIGETSLAFVHDIIVRIGGLVKVASGKVQNVETALSRLNQLQHLKNLISKRLIFGYGFSKISYINTNSNFGFINTVLVFGILGLIVIIYLLISYIVKVKFVLSKINLSNPYYKILYIFLYAWYAIILAYSFTWDFFTLRIRAVVFMAIFLGFTDYFMREALKFQKKISNDEGGVS